VKQHAHLPLSAILLIVVASACFSAVDVTVKGVALTWYERWRASLPQSEPAAVD
jgi:hypothetical protein